MHTCAPHNIFDTKISAKNFTHHSPVSASLKTRKSSMLFFLLTPENPSYFLSAACTLVIFLKWASVDSCVLSFVASEQRESDTFLLDAGVSVWIKNLAILKFSEMCSILWTINRSQETGYVMNCWVVCVYFLPDFSFDATSEVAFVVASFQVNKMDSHCCSPQRVLVAAVKRLVLLRPQIGYATNSRSGHCSTGVLCL